jgi:pyrroline-5-carboxylate reductase
MKTTTIGFIGGGRITRIFLQAFANEHVTFQSVVVYDPNAETLNALKSRYPFMTAGSLEQAASQSVVFLAVHPPVMMETLGLIAGNVSESTMAISLAPKISLFVLASRLKTKRLARMIPNATSYLNDGYNPITFGPDVRESEKAPVRNLLMTLGDLFETEESKLEAYAITSAMLPTYFWFQFKAMEDIAQQMGLTPEEASVTVMTTLKKALHFYGASGLTSAEAMDLIPVKPIGEHQEQIIDFYQTKLLGLHEKIKPQ